VNRSIKIALIQADLYWEDTVANLQKFDKLLSKLSPDTDIVILPEMFSTGFTMNIHNLEKPTGKTAFEWLKKKSQALDKPMIGSILTEYADKYYNRMYWMRPDAGFEYYDKHHLFHMGNEHLVMTAGTQRVIVEHQGFKFLLQICYDLRFPVWSRNTYYQKDDTYAYDAIIYIANWPESRKQAYSSLLKARAIENQAYVVWVNRIGEDDKKNIHSGDTQVLNAQGNIIGQKNAFEEGILYAEINLDTLRLFRNRFKVGLDWD